MHAAPGARFIEALDQSGGSAACHGDAEMLALMHEMQLRIMTPPASTGEQVIGTILFGNTLLGHTASVPAPSRS